jgi:choline dehydrogenase-like flavoprotein
MTRRFRAGIIGAGFIAGVHAHAVRAAGGVVSRVPGATPEESALAVERMHADRAAGSVEDLVTADDVDAVHAERAARGPGGAGDPRRQARDLREAARDDDRGRAAAGRADPHPNDLAKGRWLIDRNAEILEAADAKKVYRVYIDRITGNCSHQHGTTRMGDDPATSVLDRWCRAHEVDNLFMVDGGPFPTATGANPTLTIMVNAWRVAEHIAEGRFADRTAQ